MLFESRIIVQKHVINRGFDESFIKGEGIGDYEEEDNNGVLEQTGDGAGINEMLSTLIKGAIHGEIKSTDEQPNEQAKKFFRLLKEAEKELYPGCKEVPSHCIPNTLDKIQKVVRDLGLDYQKIHACVNDCVLFQKEYKDMDTCPKCSESRWKTSAAGERDEESGDGSAKKRAPCKILREGLISDGKMRHPADSMAWKHVDNMYPEFASDPRNSYWMMSMLIPGPKSPGMNIDVYLEPLVDELKQLWIHGVKAWDAKVKRNFTLRAILLWTINDFPAYAMLCGWSTKGKFACPYCHKDTEYLWLKFGCKHCYLGHRRWLTPNHKWRRNKISFNNKVETREAPIPLTGAQVLQQYDSFEQVTFGKMSKKRKQRDEETRWHNWRKKSIFFELPYWKDLLVRHNLDVMHIEKNICDSILGTLLDIEGKSKDSVKARLDMQNLGIRKDQHPIIKNDKYSLPASMYSLGKEQKAFLCKFLEGVKMPDGYASNIRRCVNMKECKVSRLKTHDYHVIFQKLLPIAIRDILPDDVVIPLIELSRFFNAICSKELSMDDLESMSKSIGETLCRLEMVFPPAFFDIMMHLPVHLAEEAKLGGPVCYRWMYPVERYLRTLKGYVRNKSHAEGSIAEGYISEECMTFCSRFLEDVDTKLNRPERHESAAVVEPPSELSIFGKIDYNKKGATIETLSTYEMQQIRHYLLTNCDEVTAYINEHLDEVKRINHQNVPKRHREQFVGWFERKATQLHREGKISDVMYGLSQGPDHRARVYNRCFINGFLFRTVHVENRLTTQNSGVVVKGDESTGNIDWYGVVKKIILLDFPNEKEVVLFKCDWYDVPAANRNIGRGFKKDKYGIIDIDTTRLRYLEDPYILGTQAEQVFYVKGTKNPNWSTVVRLKPRNLFAMPDALDVDNEGELDSDALDVGVQDMNIAHTELDMTTWSRSNLEWVTGDVSVIEKAHVEHQEEESCHLQFEDDEEEDDTYIDDGHVAPAVSIPQEVDDEFFV
ncbi:hypothetical protein U9M48_000708 [Paspalum notatum var. saurae]|uniref:Transposase n=1 Tax=Paspalum notatum var. saurae TaxID=547442 RepID=A0AAQ3PH69_PASNO